jgi:hypothetical protein
MFVNVILYGILVPATAAAVALLAGWRPWRGPVTAGRTPRAAGARAVAGGLVLAQVLTLGAPQLPPVQANDWFVLLVAGSALLGLADAIYRQALWLRWALRLVASAAVPLLLLWPLTQHTWSMGQSVTILGALALGTFGLWTALDRLTATSRGAAVPLALVVATAGSGGVLALSGSASLGLLAGSLAAAIGPAFLLALWKPNFSLARGAVPPLTVGLSGLWLNGAFYADVPTASLVLLFVAPALALVGGIKPVQALKPWQVALVRTAAVGLPLAAAAALAFAASPPLVQEPYW